MSWYEAAAYAVFAGKSLMTNLSLVSRRRPSTNGMAVFETGHALRVDNVAREILPWLDR